MGRLPIRLVIVVLGPALVFEVVLHRIVVLCACAFLMVLLLLLLQLLPLLFFIPMKVM